MTELSEDLLFGAGKVAQFIGVETRAVYHWMDRRKAGKSGPPVFDVGGQVCGRRSELSSWFSGFRDLSSPVALRDSKDRAEPTRPGVLRVKTSPAGEKHSTRTIDEIEQAPEERE